MLRNTTTISAADVARLLLTLAWAYCGWLLICITAQYIPIRFDVAFLRTKQDVIVLAHYRLAFFTHVYTSIFTLLLGALQFSKWIRRRWLKVHKLAGRAYVLLVLAFAAPSGLIMGYYGNGGIVSQSSFCIQAVLWFAFTAASWQYARKGHIGRHRQFALLSYALTASAISLRLYKWLIASTLALPPMDTYRIVSWLGWTTNVALALGFIMWQNWGKRAIGKEAAGRAAELPR